MDGAIDLGASWQAILDALPTHVALLDPQGRIVVVNQAWRQFASENGLPDAGSGIGQDYLAVCADARGTFSDEAQSAHEGIRAVLAGDRAQFALEYRCHAPTQRRWFRMMVTPIDPLQRRGAVVMHLDITDRRLAEESLRLNEGRLRAILDAEPECVKVVSADGRLLSMNPAGLQMVEAGGFAEVAGRPVRDLVHPGDREQYLALHRRVLDGGTGTLQFRIIGLHGGLRWMDTHATPLRGEGGAVEGVLSVTRDITERHQADADLERLQQLHQNILAAVGEGIYGVDADTRISFVNPAAEAILGWGEREVVGQPAHQLVHHHTREGDPYPREQCPILRTLHDGLPRRVDDEVFFRRDGSPVPVEYVVSAVRGEDGAPRGAVVCFRDIAQRQATRDALARSEERFRLVARVTANAIWDWDLAADQVLWSGGLHSVFGYLEHDVQAQPDFWTSRVHPDDLDRVRASLQQALEGGDESWEQEYRFRRRDGSHAAILDRALVVRDGDGRALRMVGGMTDISGMRTLEAQLRASQRLEAVGQLTGGLAHDFNNLLTVVQGNAELLEEMLAPASPGRELAQMILSAAQRGASLTQRLLAFARRQALEARVVRLGELVQGMAHLVRGAIGEHIVLVLEIDPFEPRVLVDPAQLENALLNLCLNARDAMPSGGELVIAVQAVALAPPDIDPLCTPAPGDYVRLEVRDTGHGVPAELLPLIVEPFFTTKDTGKGTGLGLSMVYGLVKQSGGYLDIVSTPGRGTCVRIHLPRAHEPEPPPDAAGDDDEPAARGHEHVLLVEDDALVRRYAASQLQALGYRVSVVDGAAAALRLLEGESTIELMLTDVMMPGMNGPELADAARRLQPGLPVLYSSGYSRDMLASEGWLSPDVILLAKPYRKAELARRLRQALA